MEKIIVAAEQTIAGQVPVQKRPTVRVSPMDSGIAAGQAAHRPEPKPTPESKSQPSAQGISFVLPDISLTVTEAKIMRWLKKEGEPVKLGESVVEIETEKATSEVGAPVDGVLTGITAAEGTVVAVGGELGRILPQT